MVAGQEEEQSVEKGEMADGGDRDSSQESQEHGQDSQEHMRELQLELMERSDPGGKLEQQLEHATGPTDR